MNKTHQEKFLIFTIYQNYTLALTLQNMLKFFITALYLPTNPDFLPVANNSKFFKPMDSFGTWRK